MSSWRYLLPMLLIALCFVALCTFTAVSLFSQQAALTSVLRENVQSQRAAIELEEGLQDLIALEDAHVESVSVLHERIQQRVVKLGESADQPSERELFERLSRAYDIYLVKWNNLPTFGSPTHEAKRQVATKFVETDVLRPCQEFEHFNARRVEDSADQHDRVLRQLAWGMAGIGGLGGISGIVLGFAVSRGLNRSIRKLRVQLRDAAGKIAPGAPEFIVTEEGRFHDLHIEADRLTEQIERVVRELQQREQEVLRAEQLAALGQLAAGMAHEIRNPLTSIKLLVQAGQADGGLLPAEDLRIIESEVRRMERSLSTFINFARPPQMRRATVSLDRLLDDTFGLLRTRADQQRVVLERIIPTGDVTLSGDREQLRQVVLNLGLNALDAMPTGGTLSIAIRKVHQSVEVEIADTGPGIAKEMFPRLFQPFASSKDTGLGLGLVICKRIVQDHRGRINAVNRVGGGARFFLCLPIEASDVDRTPGR